MSAPLVSRGTAELRDAHEAERIPQYLRDLWVRRSYIANVAMSELRHRQITNVLGNIWHLLNPLLTIGVYFLVFGLILQTDRGVENFFLFLTVGLFIFQFGQKATLDGAKSIVTNRGLIKAVRFPRALLPLSSTITEALAAIPTFLIAYGVALASGTEIAIRWAALPFIVALMGVFNAGTAMVAARLTTHFADTTQILPFVFRLTLYVSGVIFSVDSYVEDNRLADMLFTLNPFYCYITLGRWSLMGGELPLDLLLVGVIWSVVMLVGGFAWFRAAEEQYARD